MQLRDMTKDYQNLIIHVIIAQVGVFIARKLCGIENAERNERIFMSPDIGFSFEKSRKISTIDFAYKSDYFVTVTVKQQKRINYVNFI